MKKYNRLKNVLIVDDSDDIRFLLITALETHGLICFEASNGEEAIQILKSTSVDLMITDFRMPKLDGVGLLEWCRNNEVHIPVIFTSANADLLKSEQIALSDCCATLMLKPFCMDTFFTALSSADERVHHKDCIHNKKSAVGLISKKYFD